MLFPMPRFAPYVMPFASWRPIVSPPRHRGFPELSEATPNPRTEASEAPDFCWGILASKPRDFEIFMGFSYFMTWNWIFYGGFNDIELD